MNFILNKYFVNQKDLNPYIGSRKITKKLILVLTYKKKGAKIKNVVRIKAYNSTKIHSKINKIHWNFLHFEKNKKSVDNEKKRC